MDFIDKLRDEDRQRVDDREDRLASEHAERARKRSIAQQYYIESECQPYIEKLASYLNSKSGINGAKIYEENGYSGEGYGQNLAWDLHNYITSHGETIPNVWRYNFSAYARADGSMMIGGRQTRNIPLNEWRSNKQVLMDALEQAYRNPTR